MATTKAQLTALFAVQSTVTQAITMWLKRHVTACARHPVVIGDNILYYGDSSAPFWMDDQTKEKLMAHLLTLNLKAGTEHVGAGQFFGGPDDPLG